MRSFTAYLKSRRLVLVLCAVILMLFTLFILLGKLPVGAALYPDALSVCLILVVLLWDYSHVKRREESLERLCSQIDTVPELEELLIYAGDSVEAAKLCLLVQALREKALLQQSKSETEYRSMIDYYTAWAHQIKTPIASMKLTLEQEDSENARKLRQELFRIEQYVDMVMTYLRLDSDSTDYVFKEHDLDEIIRGSVKKFSSEFIMRKLQLSYEPLNMKVVTDDKWLGFCIEQLISNALKYTPKGSIKIYGVKQEDPGKDDTIELVIEDTGIGIEAQDLPRIFEKGFTGINGRSMKRASGLGLYLVKRTLDNLGIGIRCTSFVGEGTAMHLTIKTEKNMTIM